MPDAWWQDAVFYEIFVRSFADSSDGPLAGDGKGDLRGLIERLDYLNDGDPATHDDLGVNALWLMPVTESPSYHGYDTTDYERIDREYGTNQDFLDLVTACHARGIRVTIDLVLNHCSSEHPWFVASSGGDETKKHWFTWRKKHPEWRGPWGQPVWHRSPSGEGFYYGLFWGGMPDLNYEHEPVTQAMFDVIRFWIEEMRVDGFRLDAIRHLIEDGQTQENTPHTHAWLKRFYRHVKSIKPDAVTVGEVWSSSDNVSRYVGDQMDLAFEFQLSDALLRSIREENAGPLLEQMSTIGDLYPLGMYATFLRNHDQPRVLHVLQGNRRAAKLAAAIQFALPGVPFVYYGEEIGMTGDKPDPQIRTPMQWSDAEHGGFSRNEPWIDLKPDYQSVNVASQANDPSSLRSMYRKLIRARLDHKSLRIGAFKPLTTADPRILAFVRSLDEVEVLCVFNLSDEVVRDFRLEGDVGFSADRPLAVDVLGSVEGASLGAPLSEVSPRTAYYFPLR